MAAKTNVGKASGILLAVVIIAIAVSIVAWQAFDVTPWAIPFIILLIVGVYLLVMSFFMPRTSKLGPSPSSFYMVNGTVLSVITVCTHIPPPR